MLPADPLTAMVAAASTVSQPRSRIESWFGLLCSLFSTHDDAGGARSLVARSGRNRPVRWLSRAMDADGGAGAAGSDLHEVAKLVGEPDCAVPGLTRSGAGTTADHR